MPPLSYLQVIIPKIGITQFLTELHVHVILERSEFPTRENARDSVKTLLRKSTTSGQFFFFLKLVRFRVRQHNSHKINF